MEAMANALPLLLGAAAVFMLMGKKGSGDGDGDEGNGNGNGNGDGDDTGNGGGGTGGLVGTIKGTSINVVKSRPLSSLGLYDEGLGSEGNCARLVFEPKKAGDTYEISGWPAGTYGVEVRGDDEWTHAKDVLTAKVSGDRLHITAKSSAAAPAEFYVKFRGGQSIFGTNILRYIFFSGIPQEESWSCPANLKQ